MSIDKSRSGGKNNAPKNVSVSDIGGVDVRLIAAAAVMIAVVFVMTRVVQITIGPGGYIHFGDIALYVASFLFGPIVGAVAGGTGTALADLSSGFGAWAPGTFIIHGLQAFVAGLIAWRGGLARTIVAVIVGGAIVVVGYFLYQWILISAGSFNSFQADEGKSAFATAAAAVWPNTFQVLIAAIVAVPLIIAIRQAYPPVRRWGAGPSWVEE